MSLRSKRNLSYIYSCGKLLVWTDRRCKCGRFLSKIQKKYCSRCAQKVSKEKHNLITREWGKLNRNKVNEENKKVYHRDGHGLLKLRVYRHVDEINVGDYV